MVISGAKGFDVRQIRVRDFPYLNDSGRVYLDSTATSQVPLTVQYRISKYRASVPRGSNHSSNSEEARRQQGHYLSTKRKALDFFGYDGDVAFTSGTTASSNFVGINFPFERGDTLILTEMEHNSEVVTAGENARRNGAEVRYVPVSSEGRLDLDAFYRIFDDPSLLRGKVLMNLVHVSNVTGVINDYEHLGRFLRDRVGDRGYLYLDMAQSAGHVPISLGSGLVDFAGTSAHKMYGPTGLGLLFMNGRGDEILGNNLSGGGAVKLVTKNGFVPADSPERFEPGSPNFDGIVEFGYTFDYLNAIGMENIAAHDQEVGSQFLEELLKIGNVHVYGPRDFKDRTAVIPFNIGDGATNYGLVAREVDGRGVSVRDGCFCAHSYVPRLLGIGDDRREEIMEALRQGVSWDDLMVEGSVRASFAFYNTDEDVDLAIGAIRDIASTI